VTPASPPSVIPIAAPEAYSASVASVETTEKLSAGSEGLEDICKIDPAACPNLDMEKERSIQTDKEIYDVQQTAGTVGDSSGEILLTGPLAGAPSVRSLNAGGPFGAPAPPPPPPPPPPPLGGG